MTHPWPAEHQAKVTAEANRVAQLRALKAGRRVDDDETEEDA